MAKTTQPKATDDLNATAAAVSIARSAWDQLRDEMSKAEAHLEKMRGDLQTAAAELSHAEAALIKVAHGRP